MSGQSESSSDSLIERYQALFEVAEAITAHRELDGLCRDLAHRLPRVVQVNYIDVSLYDPIKEVMRLHTIQANVPADLVGGHEPAVDACPAGVVWRTQRPLLVQNLSEERRWADVIALMKQDGTTSFCFVPLTTARARLAPWVS